jgi:hypothetical protein
LWCVGDAQQAQAVAAGGLVTEVERLAADDSIPWATLIENRRQRDPAEQRALASLRAGAVDDSQAIRRGEGWEHEHATPAETRDALARMAVADTDQHGAEHVAVLAVSHTDCEDLADRIRTIRAARGELRGPTLQGPGWGPAPRVYAAGDRILVHTNLGGGPDRRVFNGTTATLSSVATDGATVFLDQGGQVFLPAETIAGSRPDATPNVSHAWARTVDGAQGGTWHQVHLLATPALNRHTGYVGQSRGQQPTHTWNTRPDTDHPPRLLADQRSPSEAVADAMRRAEPKTLAAHDDPWPLDRALRTERDQHAAIVATRPADQHADLERAHAALEHAEHEHHAAVDALDFREHERARLGPLTRLRRGGRDDITQADQALAGAQRRLTHATTTRDDALARVERNEEAVAHRAAWDRQHHWRIARIAAIDHTLAHHWADITLRAVHADEPLAFGTQTLRAAAATYLADLQEIARGFPDDPNDALARAETDLRHHQSRQRDATQGVDDTSAKLERLNQRHWLRRDKAAITVARVELRNADQTLALANEAVAQSEGRVAREQHAVNTWEAAFDATAEERARLTNAVSEIYDTLDRTRPQRIVAAANHPTHDLWTTLSPPPTTRGGLAAWCAIAEYLETWNDQRPAQEHRPVGARNEGATNDRLRVADIAQPDKLAALLRNATSIIHTASRLDPSPAGRALDDRATWQATLDTARHALAVEPPAPQIEYDLGLEL